MLEAVELSRRLGVFQELLTLLLLLLFRKKDIPESFPKFRLISLCNVVYKMVTKMIVERIKPKLVEVISREQFGFLSNRQILDAIRVTQRLYIP